MKITKFEELICWQNAKELAIEIYKVFHKNSDFGFKDQIQRATISISNNIAEGFERRSNKEFKHFLYIAKGSAGEVRSMLYVALSLSYINQDEFDDFCSKSSEVSRLISGLIKTL